MSSRMFLAVFLPALLFVACGKGDVPRAAAETGDSLHTLYSMGRFQEILARDLSQPEPCEQVIVAVAALGAGSVDRFDEELDMLVIADSLSLEGIDLKLLVRGYAEHVWTDEIMDRFLRLTRKLLAGGEPSWSVLSAVSDALSTVITHPWKDRLSSGLQDQVMQQVENANTLQLARTPLGHSGGEIE